MRKSAVLFVASLLVLGVSAPVSALDKTELKCRGTIAKVFAKANAKAEKVLIGCHAGKAKGKVDAGIDCNDISAADLKGKFAKAAGKVTAGVAKKCPASMGTDLLDNYINCPDACVVSTGITFVNSYTELGQCLACLAGAMAEDNVEELLGSPGALDKATAKCHAAIGKGYAKLVATMAKERTKCQAGQDKAANHDTSTCAAYGGKKNKIAVNLTKANYGVARKCTSSAKAPVNLLALSSCSSENVSALTTCLGSQATGAGEDVFDACYGLDALTCPTSITTTVVADPGSRHEWGSGYRGPNMRSLTYDYDYTVNVSCENAVPPCGECTITGINVAESAGMIRCKHAPETPCSLPFQNDPACPEDSACVVFMGPPQPISRHGTPLCLTPYLETDITGAINRETGEYSSVLDVATRLYLGYSVLQPCTVCENGTCGGGYQEGDACTVHGLGSLMGKGMSLDCTPSAIYNISGAGLRATPLVLSTATQSLAFENTCDSPFTSFMCACGMCSGDDQAPCRNDQDCADIGAGTCTDWGWGEPRQPNGCSVNQPPIFSCDDVLGDGVDGECGNDTSLEGYCDGQLDMLGNPILPCGTDADCDFLDAICNGGDCGDCSITQRRKCFLDPILAVGSSDLFSPTLAGVSCTAGTGSVAVNMIVGLPGPLRIIRKVELTPHYD